MQPVAEVAFAQLDIQLLGLGQFELAQRKKTVRAFAQVVIRAGRDALQRESLPDRARHAGRMWDQFSWASWVWRELPGARVLTQGLYETAGQEALAAFTGAPQNIKVVKAQRIAPGLGQGAGDIFSRGQAQGDTLRHGPQAWHFGRHGQTLLVTTRQHHRRQGPAKQLGQRQNHHLLVVRMRGGITRRFQRLADPGSELRGGQPCIGRCKVLPDS